MPNIERFFVIWCPESHKPITRKFASLGQAIHVRDALQKKVPDRTFHILGNIPEDIVSSQIAEHTSDTDSH